METVNSDHQVSLDINKLAESVEKELKILRPFSDKNCSIYRVPKHLRKSNESAYIPQIVSIGPLHHGREELKEMEEHKKMFLKHFLKMSKVSIQEFMTVIGEKEKRLRGCYGETFENLSSEDFVRLMLIDCSFVLMVALGVCFEKFKSSNHHIFNTPWMKVGICIDMCLLENQLPFFILEDLLKLSKIQDLSMIQLTYEFLSNVWDSWVPGKILEQIKSSEVEHFVGLLRICQQPMKQEQPKRLSTLSAPSIVELHEAGVKFKMGSTEKLLHITFDENKGILEIPQLMIGDSTEQVIRNLYAFEQCHSSISDKFISQYITFINLLVYATKDVDMLVKEGIIVNWIRDNGVVLKILHNLDKENIVDQQYTFYFSGVIKDLNKYCRKRRHKWKAALTHKYFQNPWTIISVIAGGILLILTVTQTVCSILQVV